ncbi:MAG: pyridoxamine 5'-phosphate oxidase family protein [Chloroflexi bacterium]|nr:pyridoxamine 5'-phosphate oxidase family protein [Chloroflexota bacterium]MBU1751244.1 pyridoxamine 5'-phosphate oxidase family protein [Chloroflexota bacterium]MBU1877785.1 pyridoxamine 5'-phosphate oxidase family protein [Chloroflexota bacterium]
MLSHLRQRVTETLSAARTATLSTHGAAGIQANVFPCEAVETTLYLLVPRTSDHLFNLEQNPEVVVTTEAWQLRGRAGVASERPAALTWPHQPDAAWCEVVAVRPTRLQIEWQEGLGHAETIDVE